MSDDLVSVQILAAFGSPQDRELLRQAAAMARVPADVIEAESVDAARNVLVAKQIDVAFLDAGAAAADLEAFIAAARSARRQPFIMLVAAAASEFKAGGRVAADGTVAKPTRIEQAQVLIQRCVKLRLPCRVLVVDDSATQRSIVRKLLTGTDFPSRSRKRRRGSRRSSRSPAARSTSCFSTTTCRG